MPELPEVQTTLNGIAPLITGQKITHVRILRRDLRFLIPLDLEDKITHARIVSLSRRGKYLLIHLEKNHNHGALIVHLGMSGSLRILEKDHTLPLQKHDHYTLTIGSQALRLCYHDPRRFGCLLFAANPLAHPLLANLGVEPLDDAFCGAYLVAKSAKRRVAVKSLLMNAQIVVGVGNIYASEALFCAHIHPLTPAGNISLAAYNKLARCVKKILKQAIAQGGTTLKDFVNAEGKAGYFAQELAVYGKAGQACPRCQSEIESLIINQRASYFCPRCQPLTI